MLGKVPQTRCASLAGATLTITFPHRIRLLPRSSGYFSRQRSQSYQFSRVAGGAWQPSRGSLRTRSSLWSLTLLGPSDDGKPRPDAESKQVPPYEPRPDGEDSSLQRSLSPKSRRLKSSEVVQGKAEAVQDAESIEDPIEEQGLVNDKALLQELGFNEKEAASLASERLSLSSPGDVEKAREAIAIFSKHGWSQAQITELLRDSHKRWLKDPAGLESILQLLVDVGLPSKRLLPVFKNGCKTISSASDLQQKLKILNRYFPTDHARIVSRAPRLLMSSTEKWEETRAYLRGALGDDAALEILKKIPDLLMIPSSTLHANTQVLSEHFGTDAAKKFITRNPKLLRFKTSSLAALTQSLIRLLDFSAEDLEQFLLGCIHCPPAECVSERLQSLIYAFGEDRTKVLLLQKPRAVASAETVLDTFEAVKNMGTEMQALDLLHENPSVFLNDWKEMTEPKLKYLAMQFKREPMDILWANVFTTSLSTMKATLSFLQSKGLSIVLQRNVRVANRSKEAISFSSVLKNMKKFERQFPDFDNGKRRR